MFRYLLSFVLFTFLTITPAKALVFVEPMLGYATGSLDVDATDIGSGISLSDSFDLAGLNYGIRGGLELGGFQLGLDYVQNNLTAEDGEYVELDDDSFDVAELGAMVGFKFWFLRLYGGYIFSADVKDSESDPGKGVKFGLTFYALKHLALSLEHRKVEFDPESSDGVLMDFDYSTTAIMVSFPFGA